MESNPHLKGLAEILAGIVLRELRQREDDTAEITPNKEDEGEQDAKSGDPKCESINVKR